MGKKDTGKTGRILLIFGIIAGIAIASVLLVCPHRCQGPDAGSQPAGVPGQNALQTAPPMQKESAPRARTGNEQQAKPAPSPKTAGTKPAAAPANTSGSDFNDEPVGNVISW